MRSPDVWEADKGRRLSTHKEDQGKVSVSS